MLDLLALELIVDDISYRRWKFSVDNKNGLLFVYATFDDGLQKTRKWYISPHMTKSEVVQTILALVLLAEEHEVREHFRYKNRKIFGPHFDADVMVEVAGKKANLDLRPEPVTERAARASYYEDDPREQDRWGKI